ncbi:hypothetical protein Pcinc_037446 [Petrolisthes cinctipes]|uniref:Uncharacterized protein n=1 Tax=Petrolisthes cinctipes TaxID=88211 RepID=A0AAE1EL02_PETCI|nr:hypothetical protein Pcinc_037446 [Petrolisthes cinctipes]
MGSLDSYDPPAPTTTARRLLVSRHHQQETRHTHTDEQTAARKQHTSTTVYSKQLPRWCKCPEDVVFDMRLINQQRYRRQHIEAMQGGGPSLHTIGYTNINLL